METDYSDIVAGVLQRDTLAPYMFIICLVYEHRTAIDLMKENSFTLGKERSGIYPAETITDPDYFDDIVIMVNTTVQVKSLLMVDGGIDLHVSADKTEYMCFNQRGDTYKVVLGNL